MNSPKITDFLYNLASEYIEKTSHNYIIRDLSYLNEKYIPDKVLHRDFEIKSLFKYTPPKSSSSIINIYGPTGTGKTLVVKVFGHIINVFSIKNKIPVKFIYTNAKIFSSKSSYFVFRDIVSKMSGIPIKNGVKMGELTELFSYILNSSNKKYIIAIDEADSILSSDDANDFLYLLLRSNNISLITISNTLSFFRYLDSRVMSSMVSNKLAFKPYNSKQIYDVLLDRARKAFYPNTFEDSALKYLSSWVAKDSGDMRKAIQLLKNAAILAETEDSRILTINHIKSAIDDYEIDTFYNEVLILPPIQILIVLAILEEAMSSDSLDVDLNSAYERFSRLSNDFGFKPISKTTFSRKLDELKNTLYGFIDTSLIYMGRKGKKKVIHLNLDKNKIKTVISKLYERFH